MFGGLFFYFKLQNVAIEMSAPIQEERPYLNKIINLQKFSSDLDLQLHKLLIGQMSDNSDAIKMINTILLEVEQLSENKVIHQYDLDYLNSFTKEIKRLKAALIYYKNNVQYDPSSSSTEEVFELIDESIININHHLHSIITIIRKQIASSDVNVLEGIQFLQKSLIYIVLILVFGTIAIIFVFNMILSSNLKILIGGTKKLGEGNLDWRINNKFNDEFGKLSAAFDDMAMKMSDSNREILGQTEKIEKLAYFDSLTELPNRNNFLGKLKYEVSRAQRNNEKFAVLFVDLDDFKIINDSMGHDIGDLLLKEVADCLKRQTRPSDTVARLAGDEFTVILPHLKSIQDSAYIGQRILSEASCPLNLSQKIIEELSSPFEINNNSIMVSSSIGIAVFPENGKTAEELLNSADTAMFAAKKEGKNRYKYCTEEMTQKMLGLVQVVQDIHHALVNEEFVLYYQPQVDLTSKSIIGMEALIRWNHPQRGFIPPIDFIPIAEERGIIHDISKWVIREVFNQHRLWREADCQLLPVMVNLSAHDFFQQGIENFIFDVLKEQHEFQGLLGVEVTETSIMDDKENAVATLNRLQESGVKIALDDFGTGYSSLNYLQLLPIDVVKIDRSFVKDITSDSKKATITESIISMSHALNLKVLAEGIETVEQHEFLKNIKCDSAQGYLFSKPLPADEMAKLLSKV